MGLSDTMNFLKSLAKLDAAYDSGKNSEKRKMRERVAAAALFNWEVLFTSFMNSSSHVVTISVSFYWRTVQKRDVT